MNHYELFSRIQIYKSLGFTREEIIDAFKAEGISRCKRTWDKYLSRAPNEVPEAADPALFSFNVSPFREAIADIIERNAKKKKISISSIYDVLTERFVENGEYHALPGSERSLRRYVSYLKNTGVVNISSENTRVYDHVFETAPGEKMEVDFGEFLLLNRTCFHFICLVLLYSRYMIVIGQDHKFNSEEACRAIYTAFLRMRGSVSELVIDQDSVFVDSEKNGEVTLSTKFEDFVREQKISLFVCRKADPESKGSVENGVGYVKKRFLSARRDQDVPSLLQSLPGWLNRANHRIHNGTFCVPADIFREYEQPNLKPIIPSLYNNLPNSYIPLELKGYPYVSYRSNKYFYPSSLAFSKVFYRIVDETIYLYDSGMRLVAQYQISSLKGHSFQHEGFANKPTEWMDTVQRMREKWNCADFQHFVNGVKKENPRYLNEQFRAIEGFLNQMNPEKKEVSQLLHYCCEHYRYKAAQFMDAYRQLIGDSTRIQIRTALDVGSRSLTEYQRIFDQKAKENVAHAKEKNN